jgi:hypothetical protein
MHAQVSCRNGNYYLKDHHSEFGTFVKLSKAISISHSIEFEVANNLFEMRIENSNLRSQ